MFYWTPVALRIYLLSLIGVFFSSKAVKAQGEIDSTLKKHYRNESAISLDLYSNGYGFSYRYAKRKDAFRKNVLDFNFQEIKHPKEIKYSYGGRRLVYGKMNNLYLFGVSKGKQRELYSKLDKKGVAIRLFYVFGITLGVLKPVYYEVIYSDKDYLVIERFKASYHTEYYGRAKYFIGIDELRFLPGIHARYGISVEYSGEDSRIRAVECGASAVVFPQKTEIMASEDNNFLHFSLFVSFRFGKVLGRK